MKTGCTSLLPEPIPRVWVGLSAPTSDLLAKVSGYFQWNLFNKCNYLCNFYAQFLHRWNNWGSYWTSYWTFSPWHFFRYSPTRITKLIWKEFPERESDFACRAAMDALWQLKYCSFDIPRRLPRAADIGIYMELAKYSPKHKSKLQMLAGNEGTKITETLFFSCKKQGWAWSMRLNLWKEKSRPMRILDFTL